MVQRFFAGVTALCLLVGVIVVTVPAGAAPDPLVLTPTEGRPGDVVTVEGSGFSGGMLVGIYWDILSNRTLLTEVITDENGAFEAAFRVPSSAPGKHTVIACLDDPRCAEEVESSFEVLPPPTTTTTEPSTTTTSADSTTTTIADDSTTTTSGRVVISTTTPRPVTDDYTWWATTTSSFPSYPYAGPTTVPPPPNGYEVEDVDYPDIRATAIEVTQGIQDMKNNMPLIENRRTFARLYVDVVDEDSWPLVSGVLQAWRGGEYLGLLWPLNGPITAYDDGGERINLEDSLYFRLPATWTQDNVRIDSMVWATAPQNIDLEPQTQNNFQTVFVNYQNIDDVTLHPVPLHLHRSYHPTDEVRVYQGVFGGPGTYGVNTEGNLGALDIIEGMYRYHPIPKVLLEPWASVLYPLDHDNGAEWNLGPCQTWVTDVIPFGEAGSTSYLAINDIDILFETDTDWDVDEFTDPDWIVPDRIDLVVMDKEFEIDSLRYDAEDDLFKLFGQLPPGGDWPVVGAPVFVRGCKPDTYGQTHTTYKAPLMTLSLNRVWYDWDDTSEFFVGTVDPSLPTFFGGLASPGYESTWAKFGGELGDDDADWNHGGAALLGHEVGHLAARKHVACKDTNEDGEPDELIGGSIDLSHPMTDWFPDCRIAETDPEGFYGFDVYHGLWGLDEPVIISNDPGHAANLGYPTMGYLRPRWTDAYHWCRMISYYGGTCNPNDVGIHWNPPPPEPTDGAFGSPTGPVPFNPDGEEGWSTAILTGTIDASQADDGVFQTEIVSMDLIGALPASLPDPDDLVIDQHTPVVEVFDENGDLRYRAPLQTDSGIELTHVIQTSGPIPKHPTTATRFGISVDGVQIAMFEPSNSAPVGLWTDETVDGDSVSFAWTVDDADGDDVLSLLQYSNNRQQWMTLAQGYGVSEFKDDDIGQALPGGNGVFRLIFNDGWHTVELAGPDIEVDNKPPTASILLPIPGFGFATNESIIFEAAVFDVEDRGVEPDSIVWLSDVDGELGRGPTIDYSALTPGEHEISLRAIDSGGAETLVTTHVFVDPQVVQELPDEELLAVVMAQFAKLDEDGIIGPQTEDSVAGSEPADDSGFPLGWLALGGVIVLAGGIVIGRLWNSPGNKPE